MDYFETIREIRKEKKITLKQISEDTGVSVNYLSRIERGLANPSISTMKKITGTLGIPFMSLLELDGNERISKPTDSKVEIVRRDARKKLIFPRSPTKAHLLTTNLQKKNEIILVEEMPGKIGGGSDDWIKHEGEEFGFILKGRIEVCVGDESYVLEEGDSIFFDSSRPHRIRAVGDKLSEAIWIITPPSF